MIVDDAELAQAVAEAVATLGPDVILLMPPAGRRRPLQTAGVPFVPEGYVDLDYDANGKLVLERVKQVRDPEAMAEKARPARARRQGRDASTAASSSCDVESICVHGDAPNAPAIAARDPRRLAGRRCRGWRPLAELSAQSLAR